MKLLLTPSLRHDFVDNVNNFLPPDIRVHSMSKVTKNFNSKLSCSGRRYQYMLPTYILQDKASIVSALSEEYENQGSVVDAGRDGGYADTGSTKFLGPSALTAARNRLKSFRIQKSQLDLFKSAIECYQGTQLYHNFTTGKTPDDTNARRYITSFTCSDPFIRSNENTTEDSTFEDSSEWVILSVEGQSFLLNQIRKMVGLACEVVSGSATINTVKNALSKQKVF